MDKQKEKYVTDNQPIPWMEINEKTLVTQDPEYVKFVTNYSSNLLYDVDDWISDSTN